jgi:hypothetical protein
MRPAKQLTTSAGRTPLLPPDAVAGLSWAGQ